MTPLVTDYDSEYPGQPALGVRSGDRRHSVETLPPSPPVEPSENVLATAANLLAVQAAALQRIAEEYAMGTPAQRLMLDALSLMHNSALSGGKIVFTGMGKSYKIGQKLTATLNSFGITSVSLHAADALHGDLGIVKCRDVLVMLSSSGKTPELLALLQHLPQNVHRIILTGNTSSPLAHQCDVVLPVPVPEQYLESSIYGLSAPTITTTATLAVGDAVCVTLNEMVETNAKARLSNFGRAHPGGAIGQAYAHQ